MTSPTQPDYPSGQPYSPPATQSHVPPGPTPPGWVPLGATDGGAQRSWAVDAKPKRKRRVFMWVFLAVQVLFLVWAVTGASTASGQPSDCGGLSVEDCNTASDIGTGIGVAIIVGIWFFVDVFLGVGYAVYRLAKRPDR